MNTKTTIPALDTVSTSDLDAVTGGTTGPESGARDPGNDPKIVCGRILGHKFCFPIDTNKKA